ncbi:hypothetical protein D770_25525 [Flammeovirgaceae bacterium 311]|nr:hypothetical protein D770_25525 [Flammeovirgaceae bacterium 311]
MSNRRRSFGKKKELAQKQQLVGRKEQIELFRQNLHAGPNSDSFQNIINVYGQGGVGKTTLINHFKKVAEFAAAYPVVLDMEDVQLYQVPAVMAKIADALESQNFSFKKFSKLYKEYLQKRSELDADITRTSSLVENITNKGIKLGFHAAAEFVPGGGLVKEFIPVDTIADKTGKLADTAWRKFGNIEDVELALYPLKKLTPIWLDELYECYNCQNIVLMFDTYEAANPKLDEWFVDLLNSEYGDVPENILLVFSGREKLDTILWNENLEFMTFISLKPFTPAEAKEFLSNKGITDEHIINSIISVSGCLPIYLALLVEENPDQIDHVARPTEKVVERFLRYINNPVQRKLARLAALPRKLNVDVIKRLITPEEYREGLFDWLKSRPFVQNRGGNWIYHPIVRHQMLVHNKEESIEIWEDRHYKLAAYNQELAQRIQHAEDKKNFQDGEWRTLMLEHWYHRLCANYKRELPGFLQFFIKSAKFRVAYAELVTYGEIVDQAGELAGDPAWGELLKHGINAVLADEADYGLEMFTCMLTAGVEEPEYIAYIHNAIGVAYSSMKDDKRATDHYKKALAVFPNYPRVWRNLAYDYKLEKNFDLCISHYSKAVEIDPTDIDSLHDLASAYETFQHYDEAIEIIKKVLEILPDRTITWNNLGNIYSEKLEYDEAIRCYKKAIEIQPDYYIAWFNSGNLYYRTEKYDEAIQNLKKSIEIQPDYPPALYNLAISYYKKEEYDEAIRYNEKAIEVQADYHLAWFNLGVNYSKLDKLNEAIECFKKVTEIQTDYAMAWRRLGDAYDKQQAYDEAILCYKKEVEIQPDNHFAWYNQGVSYYRKQEHVKAVECFKKATEIKPDYNYAWNYIGVIYYEIKNYEEAIKCFEKSIDIQPDYYVVWYTLGLVYNEKKANDEAIRCFEKAIEFQPHYYFPWKNLGNIYYNDKTYEEAIRCYSKALEIQADDHLVWYNLGDSYKKEQEYDEAIRCYKKAIEIKSEYLLAWYNMGVIHENKNDFDEALNCMLKCIEIQPENHNVWYDLGVINFKKKANDEAIRCFKRATEIQPDYRAAWSYMGVIYHAQKELDKAIQSFHKLIEIQPDLYAAWHHMGSVYIEKQDFDEAILCYEKAIEIQPDYHPAWYILGEIYGWKKEYDKAKRCLEKVTEIQPDHYNAWYKLGRLFYRQQEYKKAIWCVEKAIKIQPDFPSAWGSLGWYYLTAHRFAEAENTLLNYWETKSGEVTYNVPMNIGHTYLLQGKTDKAMDWYKKSISLCGKNTEPFFKGMEADYEDLRIASLGIEKSRYKLLLAELYN